MNIKVRYWDVQDKEFFDADVMQTAYGEAVILLPASDALIVDLWTGLNDKNGTHIFEGDIVRSDYNNHQAQVTFEEDCFETDGEGEHVIGFWWGNEGFASDVDGGTSKYEVIGNVHENPDLLKK